MANGYWVAHVLQDCPQLKELTIDRRGYIKIDGSKQAEHTSLENLTLLNIFRQWQLPF